MELDGESGNNLVVQRITEQYNRALLNGHQKWRNIIGYGKQDMAAYAATLFVLVEDLGY